MGSATLHGHTDNGETVPDSPSQDLSALAEDIAEHVAARLAERLTPAPDGLLTLDEAARFLAVSARTVESLVSLGELPVVRIGTGRGVRRFERAALDAFVRRNTRAL